MYKCDRPEFKMNRSLRFQFAYLNFKFFSVALDTYFPNRSDPRNCSYKAIILKQFRVLTDVQLD